MQINKDGKTLYFGDEEIDSNTEGEKKVFVTKRINGQESHTKVEKKKKEVLKKEKKDDDEIFSFRDEVVLGIKSEKENKNNKKVNSNKTKKNSPKVLNKNESRADDSKNIKEKNQKKLNLKNERKKQRSSQENVSEKKSKKSNLNTLDEIEIKNIKIKKQNDNNIKNKKVNNKKINQEKRTKRKKKKTDKILLGLGLIIILTIICLVVAFAAPIFNIKEINVNGNEKISQDTIISLSGLKNDENIFKFNSSINDKIKENPYIENVQVKRKLPNTVNITITERNVKYQTQVINSYIYIDKYGYILESSSEKEDVPIIKGLQTSEDELLNGKRLITEDLESLNGIAKIIESAKQINIEDIITEINIEEKDNWYIYLESENKKIYIGDTTNLTNKMLYIQKILENEKGKSGTAFVNSDINSGFKPYFREE